MRQKVLSLMFALVLCLALAAPALAADSDFVIENGVLTKYNGPGGDVVIPNSVTSIGAGAFSNCHSLTSVTISNGVTSIGDSAFWGCVDLTSVTIPSGVTSIGDSAFWGCVDLTSVTIPNGVTSIGKGAFAFCSSLTNMTIPNSVTSIGKGAFAFCSSLTSVTIPNSVTSIGDSMFWDCASLTSVTIPSSVTSIGDYAFQDCASLASVTIPSSVTSIGDFAFYGCSRLTSVTIPNSVTNIGKETFVACSRLTSVTIPNSVTGISGTFIGCTSLTSVTIPDSVTSIGDAAFRNCTDLTSVTIPNSVTSIGDSAFLYCTSLTDVYYGGTEAQWKKIKFGAYNSTLLNAAIHYNSAAPDAPAAPTPATNFSDVPADAWYADAVKWAMDKGITNGTGSNKFSPDKTCNTAEILTFLWRACDKPQAGTAGGFTDVAAGIWYADAAAWANSKGMVSGDTLSPETPCTRASAVMFIWQAMGKPPASAPASFKDVPDGSDYANAVAWAVENGVTNGTGKDTFSPNTICTRGQIVTFLSRAFA